MNIEFNRSVQEVFQLIGKTGIVLDNSSVMVFQYPIQQTAVGAVLYTVCADGNMKILLGKKTAKSDYGEEKGYSVPAGHINVLHPALYHLLRKANISPQQYYQLCEKMGEISLNYEVSEQDFRQVCQEIGVKLPDIVLPEPKYLFPDASKIQAGLREAFEEVSGFRRIIAENSVLFCHTNMNPFYKGNLKPLNHDFIFIKVSDPEAYKLSANDENDLGDVFWLDIRNIVSTRDETLSSRNMFPPLFIYEHELFVGLQECISLIIEKETEALKENIAQCREKFSQHIAELKVGKDFCAYYQQQFNRLTD